MRDLYKKSTLILFCLVGALSAIGLICYQASWLKIELLPLEGSDVDWLLEAGMASGADRVLGSNPANGNEELNFEYHLQNGIQFPFELFSLSFQSEKNAGDSLDLSSFSQSQIHIRCQPESFLSFSLDIENDALTSGRDLSQNNNPTAYFACLPDWQVVRINLKNLHITDQFQTNHTLGASDRSYFLNKVRGLRFDSVNQISSSASQEVTLKSITFIGRNWAYLYAFGGISLVSIVFYSCWLLRCYSHALTESVKNNYSVEITTASDQPLPVPPLQPHKLREKINILAYISSEYRNPDLSLESLIHTLGINRTKINNILKSETGQTFTAYLNKLRLKEAARLLHENADASVSEIAYSVGYNNASYFNRVFKKEYGCTPVNFRQSRMKEGA